MPDPPADSVHPASIAEWRDWLDANHGRKNGVWLINHTAASGLPRLEYEPTIEAALCYGWIDGKAQRLDSSRTMLWFSPRRKGSGWARSNKERVERLTAAGMMRPAGIARVDEAKQDGSWSRLDSAQALEVPEDLARALARTPPAARNFDAFPPSARRAILEWITLAKRPETRARRIEKTATLAAEGKRP